MEARPQSPALAARTRKNERGSALLIVFLFAAFVAIMLYREMPIVAFEAQRQKEQLLVDRGGEYKRAVKLYYRTFNGSYPASIEALENTNRQRFLRSRFKDPFTGKDDWRLLNMGATGMLIDSKVNPIKTDNGTSFAGNSTSSGSSFGSSSTASSSTNTSSGPVSFGASAPSGTFDQLSTGATVVSPIPQRPPAISASSGNSSASPAEMNDLTLPPIVNGTVTAPKPQTPQGGQNPGSQNANTQNANNGLPPMQGPGQGNPAGQGNAVGQANPNGQPGGGGGQTPGDPNQADGSGANQPSQALTNINRMLRNPMATVPQQSTSGNSSNGQSTAFSGGLAGVASKVEGRTIKVVDDQTDYSKWEFYYDPRKDVQIAVNAGTTGNQQNGTQGSSNQSSGSSFSSGFSLSSPSSSQNQTTPPATSSPSTTTPQQ